MYSLHDLLLLGWIIDLLWPGGPTNSLLVCQIDSKVIWVPIWWIWWTLPWLPKTEKIKGIGVNIIRVIRREILILRLCT
jgi:hypothetical protein